MESEQGWRKTATRALEFTKWCALILVCIFIFSFCLAVVLGPINAP